MKTKETTMETGTPQQKNVADQREELILSEIFVKDIEWCRTYCQIRSGFMANRDCRGCKLVYENARVI